jgi:hypothetical protein
LPAPLSISAVTSNVEEVEVRGDFEEGKLWTSTPGRSNLNWNKASLARKIAAITLLEKGSLNFSRSLSTV